MQTQNHRLQLKQKLVLQRRELPVTHVKHAIVEEILKFETVVIVGETGSGKTTQIPQFLLNTSLTRDKRSSSSRPMLIGCTQPRRVAATSVAKRVAQEMGVKLGVEVGYCIRFEDVTDKEKTVLKYMTDGVLLCEATMDPLLSSYAVIIIDEAHERTLHTEVLLGLIKNIQGKRRESETLPKLHVVIMSATLDAVLFSNFFTNAPVLHIEGRQFPVDILYLHRPDPDYIDATVLAVIQIHMDYPSPGDVLVFLTGQEEIETVEKLLIDRCRALPTSCDKLIVAPIFAALPSEQQLKVFEPAPAGCRKVVLATNIAETSLTICGIRYIVDCGLVKARGFNSKGIDQLQIVPVSKAQSRQRAGRAGREGPGLCFRLFTESSYAALDENTVPEIKRCNLASVILQMKAIGIDDILKFDFLEPPPMLTVARALEELLLLGALDSSRCGSLSPVGRQMSQLPLPPMYAKMLLMADQTGCTSEILSIISMISVESIFFVPSAQREQATAARRRFASPLGDHLTLLAVWTGFHAAKNETQWCRENFINFRSMSHVKEIRQQLCRLACSLALDPSQSCANVEVPQDSIRRCLVSSLFLNVACQNTDGSYATIRNRTTVAIHPSSVMFGRRPKCVVYDEVIFTKRCYLRGVTVVEETWLAQLAPQLYKSRQL